MISGLKQITIGKINEWIDLKETTMNYEEIRSEVMRHAAKHRKESRKPITAAGMELDELTIKAKELLSCNDTGSITDAGSRDELIASLTSTGTTQTTRPRNTRRIL